MSSRDFDPARLDVEAFAKASGALEGDQPLRLFRRLADVALEAPSEEDRVHWSVRGEMRASRSAGSQVWLQAAAKTRLTLECQRCLNPVDVPLDISSAFLFVHGEDAAAQLDADSEDDVLALTRALDLHELLEDELLLALPLVPRHEVCPTPLAAPAGDDAAEPKEPHPFAGLAALKRSNPGQ